MKMKRTIKCVAAVLMLAAGILAVSAPTTADEIVQVFGSKNQLLGTYPATSVGTIAFAEAPDSIVIPLNNDVKFTMIKVEGGVDYSLKDNNVKWTESKTKQIEDFWIGKFEVTQGLWKEVMGGLKDFPTTGAGSGQKVEDDLCPMAFISWEDITAEEVGFLAKLNARLDDLKNDYPELASAIGKKQFRLPSEWEWEYAAAGGKDNASLNYNFSGTKGNTAEDLQEVAVNSVSPNKASAPAAVGSKKPNALGLYDMAGNVWELCSGLGYPGDATTSNNGTNPGFLNNENKWDDTLRPSRCGGWSGSTIGFYRVSYRGYNSPSQRLDFIGFRLAL